MFYGERLRKIWPSTSLKWSIDIKFLSDKEGKGTGALHVTNAFILVSYCTQHHQTILSFGFSFCKHTMDIVGFDFTLKHERFLSTENYCLAESSLWRINQKSIATYQVMCIVCHWFPVAFNKAEQLAEHSFLLNSFMKQWSLVRVCL